MTETKSINKITIYDLDGKTQYNIVGSSASSSSTNNIQEGTENPTIQKALCKIVFNTEDGNAWKEHYINYDSMNQIESYSMTCRNYNEYTTVDDNISLEEYAKLTDNEDDEYVSFFRTSFDDLDTINPPDYLIFSKLTKISFVKDPSKTYTNTELYKEIEVYNSISKIVSIVETTDETTTCQIKLYFNEKPDMDTPFWILIEGEK